MFVIGVLGAFPIVLAHGVVGVFVVVAQENDAACMGDPVRVAVVMLHLART